MPRRVRRTDSARPPPPVTDWRTTDADEILERQLRARQERPRVVNLTPVHPVFSDFEVHSGSGLDYRVEIRDVAGRQAACTCTDFRINGLGTCKHIEGVLLHLARRQRAEFKVARNPSKSRRSRSRLPTLASRIETSRFRKPGIFDGPVKCATPRCQIYLQTGTEVSSPGKAAIDIRSH